MNRENYKLEGKSFATSPGCELMICDCFTCYGDGCAKCNTLGRIGFYDCSGGEGEPTEPWIEGVQQLIQDKGGDDFLQSVLDKYRKGDKGLTPRQCAALLKAGLANQKYKQEREDEAPGKPVVEGKGFVTGVVMSIKYKSSRFGTQVKMLLREDRGFKLWGTVPAALLHAVSGEGDLSLKGRRVCFSAKLVRSANDECFGFYNRPTKAAIL